MGQQQEEALKELKRYLAATPVLSKPEATEKLQLYLAVGDHAVSAVLTRKAKDRQLPIYYVNKSLLDAEKRYTCMEKLILALVVASRKLRHYFEVHAIEVMTNYPIKMVLRKPELSGRMATWSISLSNFDITFRPRTAIKSQALADFVADFSPTLEQLARIEVNTVTQQPWVLHIDGSSNFREAGLGLVLKSPQGDTIVRAITCDFKATNNEAEYEALIAGLDLAHQLGATELKVSSDSLLLANQIKGEFVVKDSKMASYLNIAREKSKRFHEFEIQEIPRSKNTQADALANL